MFSHSIPGDHAQMLKHLAERVIVKEKEANGSKDTVTVVNATNLEPLLSKATDVTVRRRTG